MPYMHSSMTSTMTMLAGSETDQGLGALTASAMSAPYERYCEHGAKLDENGVEYGSSRPPSPPSTGTNTPTLRIGPSPSRLWSFVPPPQYGVVEDYAIFRSSYPQDRNMEFIKSLDIRSILTLVETDPTPGYMQWLGEFNIRQRKVTIAPNKEAKEGKDASATSIDSICEALLFAMDERNHPVWIHCNQGRHRTGCVVACLRKIYGMPMDEILDEYAAYASPKQRPGDIALIKSFDPDAVFAYAKKTGFIGGSNPTFKHSGPKPITNVYELAYELGCAGRRDTPTFEDMAEVVEHLSSTMSDTSVGEAVDEAENTMNGGQMSEVWAAGNVEHMDIDGTDPAVSSNSRPSDREPSMDVSVVEVDENGMDHVERLAFHGEIDPLLDHEDVVEALA